MSSTYSYYEFEIYDLTVPGNGYPIWLRVCESGCGAGGGAGWKNGMNDYHWTLSHTDQSSGPTRLSGTKDLTRDHIQLTHDTVRIGNATGQNFSGRVTVVNPSSTTSSKMIRFDSAYLNENSNMSMITGVGTYVATPVATPAIVGIEFFTPSGNFASGTVKVYGCN